MEYLYALILTYKYAILLPIAIVEWPIIIIFAAFLSSMNLLNIYYIYIIAILGDVIGDALYYWIGRSGRKTIIPKYGHYLGITEEKIRYVETHYKNHLGKTLLFGKITQAPIMIIIIVAGITKVDFWKFLWIIFLITLPKVLIFTLIWFYFGKSYILIGHYFDNYVTTMSIMLAFVAIVYLLFRYFKKRKQWKFPV